MMMLDMMRQSSLQGVSQASSSYAAPPVLKQPPASGRRTGVWHTSIMLF